ncbi:MAG: hypothetical protein IJD86_13395 [Clostridia bacterium]|nr:hypothetical protein [Clostridia bacterium]
MRYFRCRNVKKNHRRALEERYRAADRGDRRLIRREWIWRKLAMAAFYLIFVCLLIATTYLLKMIPKPEESALRVLVSVGLILLGLFLHILIAAVACMLTIPILEKATKCRLPEMKKEILSKATAHLRDYYDLNEPYIITKCFDASDKKWINHDVCIFVACNELRITTDLIHGFLYGERDLGCYAFRRSEITLSKCRDDNRLKLELRAEDVSFILGYRAKRFIETNFING